MVVRMSAKAGMTREFLRGFLELESVAIFVEHPELIAERVEDCAGLVSCETVIAGVDCGFGTFARVGRKGASIRTSCGRSLSRCPVEPRAPLRSA